MNKPPNNPLPGLVQNFFLKYLITQRQLSPCTVASYRDSFRLLLGLPRDSDPPRGRSAIPGGTGTLRHILRLSKPSGKKERELLPRKLPNGRLGLAIHSF